MSRGLPVAAPCLRGETGPQAHLGAPAFPAPCPGMLGTGPQQHAAARRCDGTSRGPRGGWGAPNPPSEPGGSLQVPAKDTACSQPQHRELARKVEELQEKLDKETKVKPGRRLGGLGGTWDRSLYPWQGGSAMGPCSEPPSLGLGCSGKTQFSPGLFYTLLGCLRGAGGADVLPVPAGAGRDAGEGDREHRCSHWPLCPQEGT